jgi:hypothetical protein
MGCIFDQCASVGPSVQAEKLTKYLLNHGGSDPSKAKFFQEVLQIGPEHWEFLRGQFLDGLSALALEDVRIDQYGIRFSARFPITGINGETATIQTAWIVRRGERASLVTAYPLKKNTALELSAPRPLVLPDNLRGMTRWTAVHALAKNIADAEMRNCVPEPMVIDGDVVMEGKFGRAYVVTLDGRSAFSRWAKAEGIARRHFPRGVAIEAEREGQSAQTATAYANAYAKVLRRNGIECKVETLLD